MYSRNKSLPRTEPCGTRHKVVSASVLLIIENVAIFDKLGNTGVHKFFKNPVMNREQRNRSLVFGQSVIFVLKYRDNLSTL